MKKFATFFIIAFLITHCSFAQNPTPNAGFEDWTKIIGASTYYNPNEWDQLNDETSFIGILTCIRDTINPHSGNSCVKLVTKVITILSVTDTANGIITTGKLITVPPYGVVGGIPYNQRPDSISGWIEYTPTAGDSCQIEFDLRGNNNDTIGKALYQTGATLTQWTRFSAPVVYYSSGTPDTALWLISSSNGFNSLPNSTLYVDDLSVITSTGIPEIHTAETIKVTVNLVQDELIIKKEKSQSAIFSLYDSNGNLVKQKTISKAMEVLNVKDLAGGMYFYRAVDADGLSLSNGKVVIQH